MKNHGKPGIGHRHLATPRLHHLHHKELALMSDVRTPRRRTMPDLTAVILSLTFAQFGPAIFHDGFELGTTAAWSQTVPDTSPPSLPAMSRGYNHRACGFDIDDDFIYGEPEDCGICSGSLTTPADSGPELYVDCDNGTNSATCGSPDNPCGTLAHAVSDSTPELVVCFTGVCRAEKLLPRASGLPQTKIRPRSGNEVRDFEYPARPAMIVGWDRDGDGEYPPYDTDDTSIMEGDTRAILLSQSNLTQQSHFELAHFEARNYSDSQNGGFINPSWGNNTTHIYVHDIRLRNINARLIQTSGTNTFNMFGGRGLQWFAVENVEGIDIGGYFMRGSGGDGCDNCAVPTMGPIRVSNVSVSFLCGDGCSVNKTWGWTNDMEWLDGVYDCNVDAWNPGRCGGISATQCVQGLSVRGNTMLDFSTPFNIQQSAQGYCEGSRARPVDRVFIEGNTVINTHSYNFAPVHVYISNGGSAGNARESVHDVRILNNFFSSRVGYESCILYQGGNESEPQPGQIEIFHNTCEGPLIRQGFAAIDFEHSQPFVHEDVRIENNIISGVQPSQTAIQMHYTPNRFVWDDNSIGFGQDQGLGGVQSVQPEDRCEPSFVNAATGDLHLLPSDTCAHDTGHNLIPWAYDIDRQARPTDNLPTAWDRGADQIIGNPVPPPPPPDDNPPPPDDEPPPPPDDEPPPPPDDNPPPDDSTDSTAAAIAQLQQDVAALQAATSNLLNQAAVTDTEIQALQQILVNLQQQINEMASTAVDDRAQLQQALDSIIGALEALRSTP